MLKDLVQDAEELPHLRGDGLAGEAKGQRQDLLIELCGKKRDRRVPLDQCESSQGGDVYMFVREPISGIRRV